MILDMTDPKLVFLTLDTCHASVGGIDPVKFLRDHYSRVAHLHFKDTLPVWSAGKGWKGPAPSKEEEADGAKAGGAAVARSDLSASRHRRRRFSVADSRVPRARLRRLDQPGLQYADMLPGVTIEQDMAAHRKYLIETLQATLRT